MWIMPTLKYDFIWDFPMSREFDNRKVKILYSYLVSNILNKVMNNKTITEEQNRYVIDMLENPLILKEINFTPDDLNKLIEKNSNLVVEMLLKISKSSIFQE
jgi:hypothetical protein